MTHIPKDYLAEVIPCPPSVKVELVNSCNLKCLMCGIGGREKPGKEVIDLKVFERFMGEFVAAGGKECGLFFIGESTISPAVLVDALRICKRIGVEYTFLTSNFTRLTPMLAGELMESGLDSLKASINFASPDDFKTGARAKPALWDTALNNLKAAWEVRQAKGYRTKIYASSILFTDERREKMEALLNERVRPFVDEHYFLPCFGEMADANRAEWESKGWKVGAGNVGRADKRVDPLPCWSIFREAHVRLNWDGEKVRHMMSMCCFGATDTFDAACLDDVSFMDAWNSLTYQALRRKHLSGDVHGTVCEECIHGTREVKFA